MYRKIMVALDGSKAARSALESAIQLAAQEHAAVYAVAVAEYPGDYYTSLVYDPARMRAAIDAETGNVLREASAAIARAGIAGESRMMHASAVGDTVAAQLQRAAQDLDVDLVVLATHGRRGFQRLLLGSVAEAFVRLTDRPVMLFPDRASRAS